MYFGSGVQPCGKFVCHFVSRWGYDHTNQIVAETLVLPSQFILVFLFPNHRATYARARTHTHTHARAHTHICRFHCFLFHFFFLFNYINVRMPRLYNGINLFLRLLRWRCCCINRCIGSLNKTPLHSCIIT